MSEALFAALQHTSSLCEAHMEAYFKQVEADTIYNGVTAAYSKKLPNAMRYSLFAGGKRLRPFLVLEFARLLGIEPETALSYAAALEMIHTYSLIHDDLPCMDNDDLRRGKPTNHVVYGEATALLAGDTLLTDAFSVLVDNTFSDHQNLAAVKLLSQSAGSLGMAVGQQIDLSCENRTVQEAILVALQQKKTGALFAAACGLGCIAAGFNTDSAEFYAAQNYAKQIGLAFQITDDILDVTGDEKELGKKNGRDEKQCKTTYVSLFTLDGAQEKAKEQIFLAKQALDELTRNGKDTSLLFTLADYIYTRKN